MKAQLAAAFCAMMACNGPATAQGWTTEAVPVSVEIVRTNGLVIFGSFGNPNSCNNADAIYIATTHHQYEALLSASLTALGGGLKIKGYIATCTNFGWHGGTYNELTDGEALYILR